MKQNDHYKISSRVRLNMNLKIYNQLNSSKNIVDSGKEVAYFKTGVVARHRESLLLSDSKAEIKRKIKDKLELLTHNWKVPNGA